LNEKSKVVEPIVQKPEPPIKKEKADITPKVIIV
jgi:hypothetical protein